MQSNAVQRLAGRTAGQHQGRVRQGRAEKQITASQSRNERRHYREADPGRAEPGMAEKHRRAEE